jgi:single-strand DNA-binding protein
MASLNEMRIIGNLGGDPEMRFTSGGKPVTNFNVATNRTYRSKDGEQAKETEWFTVVAWDRQAESCNQFLKKGQSVYVEGRLQLRSWDGNDGQKRYRNEVHANSVIFLDRRPGGSPDAEMLSEMEDLPF